MSVFFLPTASDSIDLIDKNDAGCFCLRCLYIMKNREWVRERERETERERGSERQRVGEREREREVGERERERETGSE